MIPFLQQEGFDPQSVTTFQCLSTHFEKIVDALGVLVNLHDIICAWSQETHRIKEKLENIRGEDPKFHEEVFKLMEWLDEYTTKFQQFRLFSDKIQQALYSVKLVFEDDIHLWLDRLMRPGFSHKSGVTLLYDPNTPRDEFETILNIRLKAIKKVAIEHVDITIGGVRHSTPQRDQEQFLFPPGVSVVSSVSSTLDTTIRNLGDVAAVTDHTTAPPHMSPGLLLGPTPQASQGGPRDLTQH